MGLYQFEFEFEFGHDELRHPRPLRALNLTFDAAVGPVSYGTSIVRRPDPLRYLQHQEGTPSSIMAGPTPELGPAEFGSFPNYLAAQAEGQRAARG